MILPFIALFCALKYPLMIMLVILGFIELWLRAWLLIMMLFVLLVLNMENCNWLRIEKLAAPACWEWAWRLTKWGKDTPLFY